MIFLIGIAAAAAGAVLAFWLARASAQRQLAEQRAALAAELAAAKRDNEWLTGQITRERAALGAMREAFQSLAADALNSNRSAFLDLARTSFEGFQKEATLQFDSRQKAIDGLVQPIAETLKKVDVRLGEAERERLEAYARLTEKVSALGSTADTLSRALRTPAVRGRWGEMQLRRVVEIAGMLRRCDFDEQPPLQGDNGRLRPDLIVQLPGGKQIVVDAKSPLEAFLDAQDAADEETLYDEAPGALASGARSHGQARKQGLLGSPGHFARVRGDVPARRDAVQRCAPARSWPDRARPEPASAAGESDYADRHAHHRRPLVAAGGTD